MNKLEKLNEDFLQARKNRNPDSVGPLSTLKGIVDTMVKDGEDPNVAVEKTATKMVKNLDEYKPRNWEYEKALLKPYLPELASEEETVLFINSYLRDNSQLVDEFHKGNTGIIGRVVGATMKHFKSNVDPKKVMEHVRNNIVNI